MKNKVVQHDPRVTHVTQLTLVSIQTFEFLVPSVQCLSGVQRFLLLFCKWWAAVQPVLRVRVPAEALRGEGTAEGRVSAPEGLPRKV